MYRRHEVPVRLQILADLQGGVVSREQVLGHGLSRHVLSRLVASGAWRSLVAGIYLTVPIEPSWTALAWAGILLGGERSRLGPEASGHLYGLVPEPRPIDVLVPLGGVRAPDADWRFVRERPGARNATTRGAPPRLTAATAVVDLTALRPREDMIGLVTKAVQAGVTSAPEIRRELQRRRRHPYRSLLDAVVADVATGVESPIELDYLREVERPHGLPIGNRQQSRRGLPYCTDVLYEEFGTIAELDGQAAHRGIGAFRDMRRDNRFLLATGWITLRYGWDDVIARPCAVAYQVWSALSERGYDQPFGRCRHCAGVPEAELAVA